jgi:hypothetical protein
MYRDFKGIWIPKEIWLNPDLSVMEKLFLVEIDSLDQSQGCFASNAHFSELFGVTKGRCSQIIKALEEKNLVKVMLQREGKRVVKRLIRVVNKLNNPIKKIKYPYLENAQGSNTLINNTKERDNALDFLKVNFPSALETFLMQHKSQIKAFEKFCLDFNDTVELEKLEFDESLFARLRKYARNWIENENKYKLKEVIEAKPNYLRKCD